ncbi:putative fatty acyl-CoA reductase CG5065 [Epargyreus clarus]|uniref:putative fatty acyl-CoA reductase CG5065 n=1 Tax=Epargyreus clarus TaxID=520877 RepID=UPI003C2B2B4E
MGFLEDVDTSNLPTIPEFYDGKTIFITGGSGVMGKVLIEKLLYSCTNLKRIYLLLRGKKGLTPEQRLEALYSSPCFDRLRKERPGAYESKVSLIAGDIVEEGLGISEDDKAKIINETNIIFHVAASVRFDDTMSYAVKMNLCGTREVIQLAKAVKNLDVLVHVSTSYLNTNREEIEEVVYPPVADWRDVISICEKIDEQTQRVLTPKLLGALPNTYVFTKQMAEHMVYEQRGKLPIAIIRPSVVVASVLEPVPGWIESLNGPNGLGVGVGKGLIRILHSVPNTALDYVPVDFAIRHFLAVSWLRGTRKLSPTDDIPIYHCCSGKLVQVTLKQFVQMGLDMSKKCPLNNVLWSINCSVTSSKFMYQFWFLFLQLLPAVFVDSILRICGKKPMLVKIQRKICAANIALEYFMTQHWNFINKNFIDVRSSIKTEDVDQFFYDLEDRDIFEYFEKCCYGGRKYLLREKDEDLPKAIVHNSRLYVLDLILKVLFVGFIAWNIVKSNFLVNTFNCLSRCIFD